MGSGRRASVRAPGGVVLGRVRRELAGGWPAGLTLLSGEDRYHLDRAWDALLRQLAPDPEDPFTLTIFGRDAVDIADVVAAARSRGIFGGRRVVAVRDAAVLQGEPQPLIAYAEAPPAESYLVVRAPGALEARRKLPQALQDHAARHLEFALAARPDPREIQALARARGLELDPDLLQQLVETSEGDLYAVASELEKLAAWAGADGTQPVRVGLAEARALLLGSGSATGWELAEAIARGDLSAALAAVRLLEERGEPPVKTLGGLAWRVGQWLQAGAWLERGGGRPPVGSEALAAARYHRLGQLLRFPARLLQADRELKSRSLPAGAVLEQLAFALLGEDR